MHEVADVRREETAIDRNQVPWVNMATEFSLDRFRELDHEPVGWIPIPVD